MSPFHVERRPAAPIPQWQGEVCQCGDARHDALYCPVEDCWCAAGPVRRVNS